MTWILEIGRPVKKWRAGLPGDLNIENSRSNSARARVATVASVPALLASLVSHRKRTTCEGSRATRPRKSNEASRKDLGIASSLHDGGSSSNVRGHNDLVRSPPLN
jgi:hypothetical protein